MNSTVFQKEPKSRPQITAYLRPAGTSGNPKPSVCSVSKSTSCDTAFHSTSKDSNDIHQHKGNDCGDDRSVKARLPYFSIATRTSESITSNDSHRSGSSNVTTSTAKTASTVKSKETVRSKAHRPPLPATRPSKKTFDKARIGALKEEELRTDERNTYKERLFNSLRKIREECQRADLSSQERQQTKRGFNLDKPQRAGWQLIRTKTMDLEPYKVTKCKYNDKDSEPDEQSQIVAGCRLITTNPNDYSVALKTLHPSNKIYQSIPRMETNAKEELLAEFANAGFDLETLGEGFEEVGLKVSHDPITHKFKEIPIFRSQYENIQDLMTSRFI